MRVVRIARADEVTADLVGAVLARDIVVAGERWSKGRRLSAPDLGSLAAALRGRPRTASRHASAAPAGGPAPADHAEGASTNASGHVVVLIPEPGEMHEDDASRTLAAAVAGPGIAPGEPRESRVDLRAVASGVVRVDLGILARLASIDPVEVFTVHDARVVEAGALVASVKVAPHLVRQDVVAHAIRVARRAGRRGVVSVAPFAPRRVAAVVKESIGGVARDRFETTITAKVEGLGSTLVGIDYVDDDAAAVRSALETRAHGRSRGRADLVLTAGSASTDPGDAFFVALASIGATVVRHGVPAHPGSMLWLARLGRVPILGLPSCGAYSRATAVDLLLPLLLAGEPASVRTVARLAHGGILTRDQRHRFPAYARDLDAPEG